MSSWLPHVLIPVLATFVVSRLTKYKKETKNKWLPPGPVIGAVWTLLFALLGYLHFLLSGNQGGTGNQWGTGAVEAFLLFALAYPMVVSRRPDLAGLWNVLSLVAAFSLALYITSLSPALLPWLVPLLLWLTYVNVVF